uniref:Uncharacterized protein n=1 Tax=uncultured prokaryote TaxID=198431 RepID=A0A0H5Q7U1_9ZZZZ|nr:hypothetical protein [uncultured prokaryote]
MPVRQITIEWTVQNSRPGVSVLAFDSAGDVEAQRQGLQDALNLMDTVLMPQTSWHIAGEGREFDAATGELVAAWIGVAPLNGAGDGSGAFAVPNASMALARLNTGVVQDGRFIKGRTFIPGLAAANTMGGELSGGAISTIGGAFNSLVLDDLGLSVWHRPRKAGMDPVTGDPIAARAGSLVPVENVTVWNELAVLTRRR